MRPRPAGNLFRPFNLDNICWRCSQQLNYTRTPARRFFAHSVAPVPPKQRSRLNTGYFLSNKLLPRVQTASTDHHATQDLPHRQRRAARRNASVENPTTSNAPDPASAVENPLPQDASSALTTASTKHPANSLRRQISLLLSLSKPRLTVLIVLTAMAPYALYPVPAFLSPSIGLDTPSLSPLTLAFLTTGTALCCASANALNMLYELAWDAKMTRTRNRPLVRGLLSERKALIFAILAAFTGVGGLYFGVNPTVAFLGAANITLYAGVYTPMKRVSWLNTWVGAIIGGIPPLMGWAAAAGESATGDGSFHELLLTPDAIGGWLLAALLFAWQFPHFMALSWPIREEYKAAGHKMLCWINPARNARVALRYSLLFFPLSVALCAVGVTEWTFAVTSLPVNFWLAREAVRFWQNEGFKGSARGLFWASVWHLPVVMVLALVQKKGMWGRVWSSIVGEPDLEDEDADDEDWIVDEVGEEAEAADDRTRAAVPPIGSK
ncbi:mitochondria protoheme IX farnesyltransferase [Annulohypoxylon maeteangense]|uniref:mitochondria protoheme IX farnesyltransferase n=1 Tax=Annulohypoxylon maeteangense TaxID=1927788 RepID=UPI0020086D7B|nr:mitochondria protoheme IX farnesyltransferase [Annulohypoxylon maeteangense]KAI0881389.1 mitochondria protoheme IX farnesyltransferase [Annulohypoxylon maeteangense]